MIGQQQHHHNDLQDEMEAERSLDHKLVVSIGLNGVIVIAEVVGGLASGSLALLSDAMHNLSDVAALVVALVARFIEHCTLQPDLVTCTDTGLLQRPRAGTVATRGKENL